MANPDYPGFVPKERASTPARHPFEPRGGLSKHLAMAREGLAEEFRGLTADGELAPGLFPLAASGVSTRPIQAAAEAFLAALGPEQREATAFDVDSPLWRGWSNVHFFMMRHGVLFETMTPTQRERAFDLLRASLSAGGFQTARDVMRLNEVIGEITGKWDDYGEWLYWLSIFGTPSADAPWGWQIDGHHLIVNYFVLGDQVVMTPTFMGSEPCWVDTGKYAGTRVFAAEEANGLALMRALSPAQQQQATIGSGPPYEGFTAHFRDNAVVPYEGIRADALSAGQRELLGSLVETYVGRMRAGHAEVKLAEVQRHLDETYFGWMGSCGEDAVFYYRVHSPVLLIEFDHQTGLALDNPAPNRQHVHTVVRTPNGNDYGKDLLRQHYARHPHAVAARG